VASEYETYLRLTLPEPTVILGQELLPLSLGHLLFLERLNLLPATEPDQIVLAILVCTRTTNDIIPTIQDNWLGTKIRFWLWRFSPFRAIDWGKQSEALGKYVSEGTQTPSTISLHEKGDNNLANSGTPFLQHIKATLQSKLNYSPAEATDCPYVQAMWDYYSYHETEGNVMVCDRDHRKAMKDLADRNHDALIAEALQSRNGAKNGV
jgi:hypothetical protein